MFSVEKTKEFEKQTTLWATGYFFSIERLES